MDSPRKKTFARLTAFLYVIGALHIAALFFFWYWSIWWYDILLHALGGVWIGGMMLFFLSGREKNMSGSTILRFSVPLLGVLIIGTFWEAFEWNIDQVVLSYFQNDVVDTLSDIGADIAGALLSSVLLIGYSKHETSQVNNNNTHG